MKKHKSSPRVISSVGVTSIPQKSLKMRLNAASYHTDVVRKRNGKSAKSKERTPSGGVSAGVA